MALFKLTRRRIIALLGGQSALLSGASAVDSTRDRSGGAKLDDADSYIPPGVANRATIGALLYPQTRAELAAGVTPTSYVHAPYTAPRYGIVFDGATDSTTGFDQAVAACTRAGATLQIPDGTCIIGRLNAFTGPIKLKGNGGEKSIIKVNSSAWPYTANTNPIFSSTHDFQAENVGFDQSWIQATHGNPRGYTDSTAPSTWGGNWFGEFIGTATFNVHHCKFYNVSRVFRVANASDVNFSDNTSNGLLCPAQTVCATQSCTNVRKNNNLLIASRWNAGGSFAYGLAALYCFADVNVEMNHNEFIGHQVVVNGNSFATNRVVFHGNIVDTPIADTAFFASKWVSIVGNHILASGDCGITTDNSQYVTVVGNTINGAHVGGILCGGAVGGTIASNSITDIAQDYALIQTKIGRYASTGGAWLAGISCNFQGPLTGGFSVCVTGNTMSFVNLPPSSDIHGTVRAVVIGIYFQETSSGNWITGSVTGNYVYGGGHATIPLFYVRVPSHRFVLGGKTGTPTPGETFTSGENSFIYHSDAGPGSLCYCKKLIGAIPNMTAFTGRISGATLTSAGSPRLTWMSVVDSGNYDWTTIYSPY